MIRFPFLLDVNHMAVRDKLIMLMRRSKSTITEWFLLFTSSKDWSYANCTADR